jgi:hypothetical protein
VVNAAVSGTSSGEVYVAGYVSGATARPPGFVDRIVGDDYEVVLEQPAWNWGLWAASAEVAFTACGSLVRVQGGQPTVEFAVEGPDDSLMDVWGFADDEVVAVGGGGLIVHSVGGVATVEESGTAAGLSGVWGTDPEHVVAVGDSGVILTRSQGTWTSVPSGTNVDLNDVWGSSADDVIAVGGSETVPGHVILHFDGESWSTVHAGDARKSTVLGISGTSSSDSVAVGAYRDDAGTPHAEIFHFDGQSWVEIPNSIDKFLWSVWCSSPGDCYVGGPDDTLVHMTRVE